MDTSIEKGLVKPKEICKTTTYLQHERIEIEGIKIFGSPYTPAFCNWAFNVRRDKLSEYWEQIPNDIDILITHGPPKGVLDLCIGDMGIEMVGDLALYKAIKKRSIPYSCFGHIHNNHDMKNAGTCTYRGLGSSNTLFINASCVTDGAFDKGLTSHGELIIY